VGGGGGGAILNTAMNIRIHRGREFLNLTNDH
jgi:hypothetical protein